MKLVYFTKFDQGLSPADMAAKAGRLELDGLDLAVRAGQSVDPENVEKALPEAVKVLEGEGLCIPMVTADGRLIDPETDDAKRLYAACGDAGVPRVKLGYWVWQGEDPIERAGEIKRALAGFAALSERHGVTTLFHTHSDPYYGLNAWGLQYLVEDFPPEQIAAYLDPGHLTLDGEPIAFAFAIHKRRLGAVSLKDPVYVVEGAGAGRKVRKELVNMGDGLCDWRAVAACVKDFDGPLSFHGEYKVDSDSEREQRMAREIQYFKGLLSETD